MAATQMMVGGGQGVAKRLGTFEDLSPYAALKESLKGPFLDPHFPPEAKSIGEGLAVENEIVFKRATEIFENPVLFPAKISPSDLELGTCGNVQFASALSVLAEHEIRVKKRFVSLDNEMNSGLDPDCCYAVQIVANGVPQVLALDDYFPVDSKTNKPVFLAPRDVDGTQPIWPLLLEKAFAKVFGSYALVNSMIRDPGEILSDLTGLPYAEYDLWHGDFNDSVYPMTEAALAENLCVFASADNKEDTDEPQRSYAILAVKTLQDGEKIIKIRDPTDDADEWNGVYCQDGEKWDDLCAELGIQEGEDATAIWLSWSEFCANFSCVYRLFVYNGWTTCFHQRSFTEDQLVSIIDIHVSKEASTYFMVHQPRSGSCAGVRFSVLKKSSERRNSFQVVGGSKKKFSTSGIVHSKRILLSAGAYRIRVELDPSKAHVRTDLVLSIYCEVPLDSEEGEKELFDFTRPDGLMLREKFV